MATDCLWSNTHADGFVSINGALVRRSLVNDLTMIILQDLVTGYQGQGIGVPLNGRFASGSMTAIIGANGSGKSTLLKTMGGLLPPVRGRISFDASRLRIGYLLQQAEMDRQFPLTVFEVVAMGCWPQSGLLRRINHVRKGLIWQALERVGLEELPDRIISNLSSGQFQRMLFARLLVQEAPLILLDEPFSAIDKQTSALLMTVIEQLHSQGCTIIVVLHDDNLVAKHFPHTLWLTPNQPVWGPSMQVLEQTAIDCCRTVRL
ncbi:metal ABC transporter ATP-binding protein [Candidatus Hoaglandella endobia]|uniref:Iron(3+)-hydroxamate import ATP-binding protein FhuC n=1 Tax=Candidatus Hoaglandella endobia TaxID=1778263 RepID=A0A143WTH7_9ENTR|nr:ABC transporter ATP-binding protein [Candidatus Hoaglandella endobia]CUX97015.1 Iron(3+)-hydroxamate import ATP-binding protein FhuC [Candidatus Hoaglandella endobia]